MLNRSQYFIREHVAVLKLTDTYDILDPETKLKIGQAREEVSDFVKFMRLLINKRMMPATVTVYEGTDDASLRPVFRIRRGPVWLRARVTVSDAAGTPVGTLVSKLFSLGGAFRVFDTAGVEVALVQGNWIGWDFRFLRGETELGKVTKKWAGLGKELFTSADNYMISINGAPDPATNRLLLAAGLAIDTVLKERK